MNESKLTLKLLQGNYGVCRLNKNQDIPEWALGSEFYSITRTEDELSVVCSLNDVPDEVVCERDWKILKILGPLDFSLIGILSSISSVLAENGVSIFAISTFDTDYILLKESDLESGIEALVQADFSIVD